MADNEPENGEVLGFIVSTVEAIRDQMATKADLETIRDQMATKADIARLELRLESEIAAVRGDIEQVHLRLDSIERTLSTRLSQIESDVSRLRSVVYILAKDRPELLRLLGQEPPAS